MKLLSGVGDPLSRRLLAVDCASGRFHTVKLRARWGPAGQLLARSGQPAPLPACMALVLQHCGRPSQHGPSLPFPTCRRSPACAACGAAPAITAASLPSYDYAAFTGQAPSDAAPPPLQLIPADQRITPRELQQRCAACLLPGRRVGAAAAAALAAGFHVAALRCNARLSWPHPWRRLANEPQAVLVDVRPAEQYNICRLPGEPCVSGIRLALWGARAAGCARQPRSTLAH